LARHVSPPSFADKQRGDILKELDQTEESEADLAKANNLASNK
jgi:hypothetical protein